MSELTIMLIALAAFAGGYVAGHIHALISYHKRRDFQRRGEGWNG